MKRFFYKLSALFSAYVLGFFPAYALAQRADPASSLKGVGTAVGGETDLPTLVGNFINIFIGVLGIVFVILVVYAGYLYLTAAGETDKVEKAKRLLGQAIIGLVIVLASYAIANFVVGQLSTATK